MIIRFDGRMFQAWEGTNKARYSCLADSPLEDPATFANGGSTRIVFTGRRAALAGQVITGRIAPSFPTDTCVTVGFFDRPGSWPS